MSDVVEFELPENLTIATVEELHEQLESLLNDSKDIVFEAASVNRADTAGLQTLLAFQRAMVSRSLHLSWSKPSKPLIETAELLGMNTLLSLN